MKYKPRWVIVQHSAMGYKGDTTFFRGLETRQLRSKAEELMVLRHGGITFDTYAEAEDYAYKEMYDAVDSSGFVPQAPGGFSNVEIDGLRIYKPVANFAQTRDM